MIDLTKLDRSEMRDEPFRWGAPAGLYSPEAATRLARSYPRDHFKTVQGYDGEKDYEYEVRCLIGMGASEPSDPEFLSGHWRSLAADLLSDGYRRAIADCTGCDTSSLLLEANAFYYSAGAWMGPHVDLQEKVVTHVLYFNESWIESDGGCLAILRSSNPDDVERIVTPHVGQSSLLVRSDHSWHAVTRVRPSCLASRTAVTVTFWKPGSRSSMWPAHDTSPLHWYTGNLTRADWMNPAWRQRATTVPHSPSPGK